MIKTFVSLFALLFTVTLAAQSTRIKGRITDEATGEGIPFVGIYFKNTTIGVSSDLDLSLIHI